MPSNNKRNIFLLLTITVLGIVTIGVGGWYYKESAKNQVVSKKEDATHEDYTEKKASDYQTTLNDLTKDITSSKPKGENWYITYEVGESDFADKIVVWIDSKSDEASYKKSVSEASSYFTNKGFDPCKEPLKFVLTYQFIKSLPPQTTWTPCN